MKKFADKPFALVGVNSDTDRERMKKRRERYQVVWRSFWNGREGPYGPISKAWNVPTWPWLVVLDEDGIVRHQAANDHGLEKILDDLVAAAEQG